MSYNEAEKAKEHEQVQTGWVGLQNTDEVQGGLRRLKNTNKFKHAE
jgi:hypothetical protein